MECVLCKGRIRRGQTWVSIRAFVTLTDANKQLVAESLVLEDGASHKDAHLGCMLRRAPPELVGISWGEPRDG